MAAAEAAAAPPSPPSEHPRLLVHNFFSPALCKELEFIHRSCGAAGYRAGVLSTTLPHLVATNCAHLLLPFIPIRDRIRDLAEHVFGCPFDLFFEFTGLISWCKGAYIGWHSDDNRSYLKQRHFAAVCYLNSHGKDFTGGVFHFKDGQPSSVVPVVGDVLIYTADSRNVHSVDQVIDGERLTLTIWFTRDSAYDEDAKLINLISQRLPNYDVFKPGTILPFPASDNMYWFPYEHLGFDIRCARMHVLGFHFCSLNAGTSEASVDTLELLSKPLRICRNDEMCENEFVNSLHALQVAQFYYWRAPELASARREMLDHQIATPLPPLRKASDSELVLPCSHQLAETVFGLVSHDGGGEFSFTWAEFELAVKKWEDYMSALHKDFLSLVPYWISNQSISYVNPSELEKCNEEQR